MTVFAGTGSIRIPMELTNYAERIPLLVAALVASVSTSVFADDSQPALIQTRFAEAPQITSPTGVSVSPGGVVFVSCDPNGVTNTKRLAGKVVRCEDTDGDGRADKFSTFIDAIDSPRGSCYVGDTLYLMQPPMLVAWQDLNHDGVAETRTTLVTNLGQGLKTGGVIHGPNGVRMGIDGWLYLAIGDQGCLDATGTDGSKATLRGGGVLRVRPDGSRLRALVTGTRNIYDVAVDPYLNLFARDNTNDGGGWGTRLHHLTELADFGYPSLFHNFKHEAMPSLADYGPGSGAGMYYLHEPGYPDDFGDALYSGDFNTGLAIHRRKPFEATFQVRQERFMNSPKNIDIDVDGASRIYCASRQGGSFGYASKPFGHVDLIQPSDRTELAVYPNIDASSDQDLIVHLASRSQVTRVNAMRAMVTRGSRPAFTAGLLALAENTETPLYARVAAVMTLKQIDGRKSHAALAEFYEDPELREFIVRALCDVVDEIDEVSRRICLQGLADKNPRVQLRAIVGLSRSADQEGVSAILALASEQRMGFGANNSTDRTSDGDGEGWSTGHRAVPHTALKALVKLNAVGPLLANIDNKELRETALRGLQEIHSEQVVAALAEKVEATNDEELTKLLLLTLFRLYHREAVWDGTTWWQNRPDFRGPYYNGAPWEHTPEVKTAIEAGFNKASPSDYRDLFQQLRLNRVPERELNLEIDFDEALALLGKQTLSQRDFNLLMNAAIDSTRPVQEQLRIYEYFKDGPLPDSYLNRVQILRKWGEAKATQMITRHSSPSVGQSDWLFHLKPLSDKRPDKKLVPSPISEKPSRLLLEHVGPSQLARCG